MIRYSTVLWCPRPDRGEFVNVAMLAWDETGDFNVRMSNLARANRLAELPAQVREHMERELLSIASAEPNARTAMVNERFREYRNTIQFRVPMPTAYESVDKAINDLFPLLVGDD